jgi:hypothetical protein
MVALASTGWLAPLVAWLYLLSFGGLHDVFFAITNMYLPINGHVRAWAVCDLKLCTFSLLGFFLNLKR